MSSELTAVDYFEAQVKANPPLDELLDDDWFGKARAGLLPRGKSKTNNRLEVCRQYCSWQAAGVSVPALRRSCEYLKTEFPAVFQQYHGRLVQPPLEKLEGTLFELYMLERLIDLADAGSLRPIAHDSGSLDAALHIDGQEWFAEATILAASPNGRFRLPGRARFLPLNAIAESVLGNIRDKLKQIRRPNAPVILLLAGREARHPGLVFRRVAKAIKAHYARAQCAVQGVFIFTHSRWSAKGGIWMAPALCLGEGAKARLRGALEAPTLIPGKGNPEPLPDGWSFR